nr:uncharacterized protein LOC128681808 [Plodia interpunctella]
MENLFNKLPNVDKCCFLIPLKIGCSLIAIYYLLSGTVVGEDISLVRNPGSRSIVLAGLNNNASGFKYTCYESIHRSNCTQYVYQSAAVKVFLFFHDFSLRIASALLLIGIYIEFVMTVTVFLYVYTITLIIDILVITLLVVIGTVIGTCPTTVSSKAHCVITIIVLCIVGLYIIITINGLRTTLIDRASSDDEDQPA